MTLQDEIKESLKLYDGNLEVSTLPCNSVWCMARTLAFSLKPYVITSRAFVFSAILAV